MNLIIQKQEDTIAQLQLAVEHYLEGGNLELALTYSELFKLNCEAYKSLISSSNTEVKEEKPSFRFGKQPLALPLQSKEENNNCTQRTAVIASTQAREDYENRMFNQYLQQQPQQPQQPVVSKYSYSDGQNNPKIRANDAYGNWGGNGEPNEIITPPQELISRYAVDSLEDDNNLWGEDPRRSLNKR